MSLPVMVKRFTPQEYYRIERAAGYKSDYYNGEIFATAEGTIRHSLITSNLNRALGNRLENGPCTVYDSNLRLRIKATGLRTYPDVSVYCDSLERDEEDPNGETVTNPTIVVEVLSKSTEGYDRGFKAENYRRIESLRAYLLVSQTAPHVEMYERQHDGLWVLREASGLDARLRISALEIDLPFAETYARVELGAEEEIADRGPRPV